jgi:hypothetical protein
LENCAKNAIFLAKTRFCLSEKSVPPIYDFKAVPQTKFESGTLPKKKLK